MKVNNGSRHYPCGEVMISFPATISINISSFQKPGLRLITQITFDI